VRRGNTSLLLTATLASAALALPPAVSALAPAALTLAPGVSARASAAPARQRFDVRVFARIGPPGQPEPVAVGPDGRVYVGTNQQARGDTAAPSKVFAFSQAGKLVREYELRGQPLGDDHGIQGLAFDANGLLYALDRSADPRVVALDPATGAQRRYATFADVPPCPAPMGGDCSATINDGPAGPDYATFAPTGDLYVTDIDQASIWRVPSGGGPAQLWFTDARLESVYGPNGIQFEADGRTLLFTNTASNPSAGNSLTGRLYELPVLPDGTPGELTQLWESRPLDAPDGFALARSGNVYVALAGTSQMVLVSPAGEELARTPATAADNEAQEVPFDGPASVAFLGERLLVSNQSPIAGNSSSWAVLDVFAGEPGLPLNYPAVTKPALRLSVRPRRVPAGELVVLRVRVTRMLATAERPVRGATVAGGGRRAHTDRRGRARLRVVLSRGEHRVRASRTGMLPSATTVRAVP
jgi:sugar lactone lactonase YvrE